MLRESNNFFDNTTKNNLYQFILKDFAIDLKTENSDENIKDAVSLINSYFNKNKDDLLTAHKTEYGFIRNLAGSNVFLSVQLFAYSIILFVYYYFYRHHLDFSLGFIIILIICPLLLILSLILGKYVYPNTVKDREYTYAKTLLITYYRESNFNKIK